VRVTNQGTNATGTLTVARAGGGNVSLSTGSITSIDASPAFRESAFNVRPKAGLGVGTYTATVTVSGSASSALTVTFTVKFVVSAAALSSDATLAAAQVKGTAANPGALRRQR